MSDAEDAVRAAKGQNLKLAASCLVRKEALVAELAALEQQRAGAAELAAVSDPKSNAEARALLVAVEDRIAAKRTELAAAERNLEQALGEVKELDELAGKALAADAQAIAASALEAESIVRSPEQGALDNVRRHIATLDAQARLEAGLGAPVPGLVRDPAPTSSPAPGPVPTMSEAEARAELMQLRAKLGSGPKPKKTL